MKYLTEQQIKKYQNDGFLLLRKFFTKDELEPIIKSIEQFSRMKPNDWELGKEMAYYETSTENEDERILCRVEKYVDYHQEFRKLANSDKILSVLEDLMGGSCILFKDKINFKRPNGGGFRPHQDVQARWDDFVKYTMSVMISTDQSTPDNGCLENWAKQGVLLLNSVLTVESGKANSHKNIGWEKFTESVIELISHKQKNLN